MRSSHHTTHDALDINRDARQTLQGRCVICHPSPSGSFRSATQYTQHPLTYKHVTQTRARRHLPRTIMQWSFVQGCIRCDTGLSVPLEACSWWLEVLSEACGAGPQAWFTLLRRALCRCTRQWVQEPCTSQWVLHPCTGQWGLYPCTTQYGLYPCISKWVLHPCTSKCVLHPCTDQWVLQPCTSQSMGAASLHK